MYEAVAFVAAALLISTCTSETTLPPQGTPQAQPLNAAAPFCKPEEFPSSVKAKSEADLSDQAKARAGIEVTCATGSHYFVPDTDKAESDLRVYCVNYGPNSPNRWSIEEGVGKCQAHCIVDEKYSVGKFARGSNDLTEIKNRDVDLKGLKEDDLIANVSCKSGHYYGEDGSINPPRENKEFACKKDGTFGKWLLKCHAYCKTGKFLNAKFTKTNDSEVMKGEHDVECDKGYYPNTNFKKVYCDLEGNWKSGEQCFEYCTKEDFDARFLEKVIDGDKDNLEQAKENTVVHVKCKVNDIETTIDFQCKEDGKWKAKTDQVCDGAAPVATSAAPGKEGNKTTTNEDNGSATTSYYLALTWTMTIVAAVVGRV